MQLIDKLPALLADLSRAHAGHQAQPQIKVDASQHAAQLARPSDEQVSVVPQDVAKLLCRVSREQPLQRPADHTHITCGFPARADRLHQACSGTAGSAWRSTLCLANAVLSHPAAYMPTRLQLSHCKHDSFKREASSSGLLAQL